MVKDFGEVEFFKGQTELDRWDKHQKDLDDFSSESGEKGGEKP